MIKFDVGKNNKATISCTDQDLFQRIRDFFSVSIPGAVFAKKYNKFAPTRKFYITPKGSFEIGLYWEIKKWLIDNQITTPVETTQNLLNILQCEVNAVVANNFNLKLRDYQYNTLALALKAGRGICVLGTGAGKTLTTASLVQSYYNFANSKHFKCLIIVPDLSLVNQTYKEFLDVGVTFSVTRWTGSLEPDFTNSCIICNIAIIQRHFKDHPMLKFVDLLIVDECHKVKASESAKIINSIQTIHKYGFTGTLPDNQGDRWAVIGELGPVLTTKTSAELRAEKFLVDVSVNILNIKYKAFKKLAYKDELKFIYESTFRNNIIKKISEKYNNNILILVNHIKHGETIFNLISEIQGKQVFFIRGDVEVDERDKIKQILENNTNVICIAISAIFSTGINIKNIHMILFAAGGKSFIRTVQSIGRGLRLHPTKTKLSIIDLKDDLEYGFKHGEERQRIYDKEQISYNIKDIVEI